MDYGLWYLRSNDFSLHAYIDVDWAGCVDDMKSNCCDAFVLGDRLVSWHSKKQESISLSTLEAKYIAAVSCCTQLL